MRQSETECWMVLTFIFLIHSQVTLDEQVLGTEKQMNARLKKQDAKMRPTTNSIAARLTRGALLFSGFLCLGLLSACSDMKTEVIGSKSAASHELTRHYVGHASRNSLWSIERR